MVRDAREADRTAAAQPPEMVVLLSHLPDHFAATFAYDGHSSAAPSARTVDTGTDSTSIVKSHELGFEPRRSARARRVRTPHLDAFAAGDDDNMQQRQSSTRRAATRSQASAGKSAVSLNRPDSTELKQSNKPRKRIKRTRDDPNSASGSIYAHLKGLPDLFSERNDIMFCGINPGVKSASSGHHFAHRSNHFYPSLHLAGITEHRMKPEQDVNFPHLEPFSLGLTNLAGRPTAEGAELLPSELITGIPLLLEKVQRWKPKTVCFVGKGISEAFIKGLKQADAINKGVKGKSRPPCSSGLPRSKLEPQEGIKREEEPGLPTNREQAQGTRHLVVTAEIPSDVLLASPAFASALKDEDDLEAGKSRAKVPWSPQKKAKKVIYTKGNSKDDAGYGLLPICVPHSESHGRLGSLTSPRDVTLFFVTPSSSARVTTHFLEDKARILSSLRVLVQHLGTAHARNPPNGSATNGSVKREEEPEDLGAATSKIRAARLREASKQMQTVELEVVDVTPFGLVQG